MARVCLRGSRDCPDPSQEVVPLRNVYSRDLRRRFSPRMQLSLHADYALRVLDYVATHRDRVVRTEEISRAYGISKHHLVRVVQTLANSDYLEIHTGRSGGVTLAREPEAIRLGDVVQAAEPNM